MNNAVQAGTIVGPVNLATHHHHKQAYNPGLFSVAAPVQRLAGDTRLAPYSE